MKIHFLPRQSGISDMLTQIKRFIAIGERLDFEVTVLALPNGRVSNSCNLSALLMGLDPSAQQNHGLPILSVIEFGRLLSDKKACFPYNEYVVRSEHGHDVKALYSATGANIATHTIDCVANIMRRGSLYEIYAARARQKPLSETWISLHIRLGDTAVIDPHAVAWAPILTQLFADRLFFTYNSLFYSPEALVQHLSSHSFLKRFLRRPLCNDYVTALSAYLSNSGRRLSACPTGPRCDYRVALNSDGFTLSAERLHTVSRQVASEGLPDTYTITQRLNQHYLSDLMQYSDASNVGETDSGLLESILNGLLADVVFKGVSAFPLDIREALMLPKPLIIKVQPQGDECCYVTSSHAM